MSKRLEVRIITSSTMAGYKNGREGDKIMHNFEHGAKFVFQTMSLKCTDVKVRHELIIYPRSHCLVKSLNQNSEHFQ